MNLPTETGIPTAPAWYETWFDSSYYHLLYQYRDEQEARAFIDRLLAWLKPAPNARILDLACGKGRYSRYLAEKGFSVIGLDLSEHSIEQARAFETDHLQFFKHDMRLPYRTNYFDYIFNFFTSFGYFDRERDDLNTLKSAARGLHTQGIFVLDFFNAHFVRQQAQGIQETRTAGGITFHWNKVVRDDRVIKTISFEDQGHTFQFEERVRLFDLETFERLFAQAGLRIKKVFGNYQLDKYIPATSPRLILVAEKI